MFKKVVVLLACLLLCACTHQVKVMKLEEALQSYACAVKDAMGNAATDTAIEVTVAQGVEAGVSIPVVAVTAKGSMSRSEKVTVKVDLQALSCPKGLKGIQNPARIFILDTNTGILNSH